MDGLNGPRDLREFVVLALLHHQFVLHSLELLVGDLFGLFDLFELDRHLLDLLRGEGFLALHLQNGLDFVQDLLLHDLKLPLAVFQLLLHSLQLVPQFVVLLDHPT